MKKKKIFATLLLSGCMLATVPAMAQDQTVSLTTAKAAGSQITLLMNRVSGLSVDWGNGTFVPVEKGEGSIIEVTGTVLGENIVVKGGSAFTMLGCAGNELTSIDATGATNLRSLYCQNNKLTSLKITGLKQLTDLDCSNNELAALPMTGASYPAMEVLNVSNNSLGGVFGLSQENVQYIDLSGNLYTSVAVKSASNLKGFFAANNKLRVVDLSECHDLSALMVNGNQLTAIVGDSLPNLEQVVCDGNKLTTLPLSKSAALDVLSCQNNGTLSNLNLNNKTKLSVLYCGGNKLTFSSLPGTKPEIFSGTPQAVIELPMAKPAGATYNWIKMCPSWAERKNAEYVLDLSGFRKDASGQTSVKMAFYSVDNDNNETLLVSGSSSSKPNDYYNGLGSVAIFKAFTRVYVAFTHPRYPDLVLRSEDFTVRDFTDPDGIGSVAAENGLEISVAQGQLVLASGEPVGVSIYSADGKLVWQGRVEGNATTVSLPHGLYIVNGKKVVI